MNRHFGYNIANGSRNIFIGQYAGKGNTSGGYNIVFGAYAASAGTLTGAGNITLGQSAGRNLAKTASCNIYIGAEAGCAHNTNSNNNVGMGKCAFQQMTSGYSNIALGTGAGPGNSEVMVLHYQLMFLLVTMLVDVHGLPRMFS